MKEGGSTTFRRCRKQRGLEPDNCYWIVSEPQVRGKLEIDLAIDPPPDLAIEVDVTHGSLARLDIYAALGVSEVCRFDGQTLTFHVLENGSYSVSPDSRTFPGLTADDLIGFVILRMQMDENAVVRQFRAWIQERIATGWK